MNCYNDKLQKKYFINQWIILKIRELTGKFTTYLITFIIGKDLHITMFDKIKKKIRLLIESSIN